MKKSHKREIFMARLIFGAFVLLVVLLIVAVVLIVSGIKNGGETQTKTPSSENSESVTPGTESVPVETGTESSETGTEAGSTEDENTEDNTNAAARWIKGDSVNFRAEPNTDCDILGSFSSGTEVELISEEDGWAKISYNGTEGYVKSDFLTDEQPE